jgi:hypothetical protein
MRSATIRSPALSARQGIAAERDRGVTVITYPEKSEEGARRKAPRAKSEWAAAPQAHPYGDGDVDAGGGVPVDGWRTPRLSIQ